jgi:hypothetical protein
MPRRLVLVLGDQLDRQERRLRRLRSHERFRLDGRSGRGVDPCLDAQGQDCRLPLGDAALSRRPLRGWHRRGLHRADLRHAVRNQKTQPCHARRRTAAEPRPGAGRRPLSRHHDRRRTGRMAGEAGPRDSRPAGRHPLGNSSGQALLLVAGGIRGARPGPQATAARIFLQTSPREA